ncbi:cytochrome P450 [Ascobolus immersus RN42]|uniref:Cytochrome P450 n=1 Tax=Ascobolus immersus RN42 TaxID=1160509 RepID=A0A3N4IU93_ASCIM|nr:cytochrome P450 [Ascobolus immersus RN42]
MTARSHSHSATKSKMLVTYALLLAVALLLAQRLSANTTEYKKLKEQAALYGGSWIPGGWVLAGIKAFLYVPEYIRTGYHEYNLIGKPFRVPNFFRGDIVFLPSSALKEVRSASSSKISNVAAIIDTLAIDKVLINKELQMHPYHIDLTHTAITKNLASIVPDLEDEITHAFNTLIEPKLPEIEDAEGWTKLEWEDLKEIMDRTANRTFVGFPQCRNRKLLRIVNDFTSSVVTTGIIMGFFPMFLRAYIAPFAALINNLRVKRVERMLAGIITQRLELANQFKERVEDVGSQQELPNDFLQALVNTAIEHGEGNVSNITLRIMVMDFSSIHTTNNAIQNCLLNLASTHDYQSSRLETYVEELRTELLAVYADSDVKPKPTSYSQSFHGKTTGWTLNDLQKLVGLDSFIGETLRLHYLNPGSVLRKVTADHGFDLKSIDLHLPNHTIFAFAGSEFNQENYEKPKQFNGFRSSLPYQYIKEQETIDAIELARRHGFTPNGRTSTNTGHSNFLSFGTGRHACSGRFYAVAALKLMLKHVLLNYDVRLEGGRKSRPECKRFFLYQLPYEGAGTRIEIRRRRKTSQ